MHLNFLADVAICLVLIAEIAKIRYLHFSIFIYNSFLQIKANTFPKKSGKLHSKCMEHTAIWLFKSLSRDEMRTAPI